MLTLNHYSYPAEIIRVVDGDTIDVRLTLADVDVGFDIYLTQHYNVKLRLAGINAPEKNTPEGKTAKTYLASILPPGTKCVVLTIKDKTEKYGRYLAWVFVPQETSYKCVNDALLADGMAVKFMDSGLTKPEQPPWPL
jgi:micrococcal nuclease